MNRSRYERNTPVPVPRYTTIIPAVVINQNINAKMNEFPKKEIMFFENPLAASLKPVYILQETLSSPVVQAIRMFDSL